VGIRAKREPPKFAVIVHLEPNQPLTPNHPQKRQQIRLSSPAIDTTNLQPIQKQSLNPKKINHPNWQFSYPPLDKIELESKNKARPRAGPSHLTAKRKT
jgi:hypothetical protein